jgi:hypothetical protein
MGTMLAPGFWLGICGPADLGDFERLYGKDCGELGVGKCGKRWVSAGFCGGLLHDSVGLRTGYPLPPGVWGILQGSLLFLWVWRWCVAAKYRC